MKTFRSEKGNALILILGFIVLMTLLLMPLLTRLNAGLLHAVTDGNAERAYTVSESVSVIYTRLLAEAAKEDGLTADDIVSLKDQLNALGLIDGISIVTNGDGDPVAVRFTDASGSGSGSRTGLVELKLEPPSSSGGEGGSGSGPAAGSSGSEFYFQHGVVKDNAATDRYFVRCGEETDEPSGDLIDNGYPDQQYATEFTAYANYYVGSNFTGRFAARPLTDTPESLPVELDSIDNTVTNPAVYVIGASGPGVDYAGPVLIDANWGPTFAVAAMANGSAVEAAGDLSMIHLSDDVTLNGALKIGGSLTTEGIKKLTINGDVLVRGNVNFGGFEQLTIHGRLIAGGGITFGAYGNHVIVDGGIISGGNVAFQGMQDLQSGASVSAVGSINFGAYIATVAIGQWNADGSAQSGDSSRLVAGTSLATNGMAVLKATGDISAPAMTFNSQVQTLLAGGSLVTNGSVNFPSTMVDWSIGGHLSAGGALSTGSMRTLTIGQSLYAGGGATFQDIGDFRIGGSLLSQGTLRFANTISSLIVNGDVIALSPVDFVNITDLQIGGTLAASGNITFGNTIAKVAVGGDLVTTGSIGFTQNIDTLFQVQGYMIALANISFGNNIASADVTLGGFYAGGTTTFPDWFQNGGSDGAICIQYQSPDAGGSGGSGTYTIGDRTTAY